MRAHSPIPLRIVGLSLANNTAWIGPVIGPNNSRVNLVDIHYYPNYDTLSDSTRYREWLASPDTVTPWRPAFDPWIDSVRDSIRRYSGGYQIDLAVCEYNSGLIFAPDPVWWNYVNGLFIADVMGHLIRKNISIGGIYSIYDRTDTTQFPTFGIIRGDSASLRMACHVVALFRQIIGNNVIKTISNAVASGTGLEAYGTRRADGDVGIIFVNKDPHNQFAATMNLRGFISSRRAHKWTITNNAPVGAPWNGTTGIVDRGYISCDTATVIDTIPRYSVAGYIVEKRSEIAETNNGHQRSKIRLVIYPNPANNKTDIRLEMADMQLQALKNRKQEVSLKIYDPTGRLVKSLNLTSNILHLSSIFSWDGRSDDGKTAAAGVYFVRLTAGRQNLSKSFVKLTAE